MNRQKLKVMKRRNKRLDNIKIDLYRQWTMFTRAPLLVLFASSLIGGMAITWLDWMPVLVRVLVGLATFVYICVKIYKLYNE